MNDRIIPNIAEWKKRLGEDIEGYLEDEGNYQEKGDNEISTQSNVNGTKAGTKSITTDEYANDQTRNNYWWSRATGGRNINCNKVVTTKSALKETVQELFPIESILNK